MAHTPLGYADQEQSRPFVKAMAIILLIALHVAMFVSCSQTASKTESDSAKVAGDTAESASSKSTPSKSVVAKADFDTVAYSGPTFTLATPDGSTMTFTDLLGLGKPLVINFWGTWCGPCRREMPEFIRIYKEYQPQGIQIVGIALRDTPERVSTYTEREGITWPMVLGNLETAQSFGSIRAVPTTIFYDSQGLELSRYIGPLSYQMFKERIESALLHEKELANL